MWLIIENCTSCKHYSMGGHYEPDTCILQDDKTIYDNMAECTYFEPSLFERIAAIFRTFRTHKPKRELPESKPVIYPYKK